MAEIRTVAVIGAGIMGRGIADAAALGGYRTIWKIFFPPRCARPKARFAPILIKQLKSAK